MRKKANTANAEKGKGMGDGWDVSAKTDTTKNWEEMGETRSNCF